MLRGFLMCASGGTTILTTVLLSLWICRRKQVAPEYSSAFPSKVLTFFRKKLRLPQSRDRFRHDTFAHWGPPILHTPLDYLDSHWN